MINDSITDVVMMTMMMRTISMRREDVSLGDVLVLVWIGWSEGAVVVVRGVYIRITEAK